MKRYLLAIALVGALVAACNNSTKQAEEESCCFKSKIENCTNPDSIKCYVDQAVAYAQELAKEGKVEEAKKYIADIQAVVATQSPEVASYFDTAVQTLNAIPGMAVEQAEAVKDAAVDSVNAVVEGAKEAATNAVAGAEQAAANAANNAVNAANAAAANAAATVNNAATNAANAANAAASAAQDKAANAVDNAAGAAKKAFGR